MYLKKNLSFKNFTEIFCCYFSISDWTGITVVEDLSPPRVLPHSVLQKLPGCNRHSSGYHSGQLGCT